MRGESCNARSPLVSSVLSLTVNNLTYSLGMSLGRSQCRVCEGESVWGSGLGWRTLPGPLCPQTAHYAEVLRERDA